jgi:alkylation response protein AidB-like acyl-CoA dehydrogenase
MANEQLSQLSQVDHDKANCPIVRPLPPTGKSVVSDRTPGDNFPTLMAATEQLAPLVEEDAKEAERLSRQTDRVVAALRKSGIYSMLLPCELGGPELAFADAMRIIERLAWTDGSTGWCAMVANLQTASAGSHLSPEGARLVYGNGPDISIAGQGVPSGRARRVADGYIITGRWSYGSGIHHAD